VILRGKKILLISPQSWDKVKVSKHHYALTLAGMGNDVYFLNPPLSGKGASFEKKPGAEPGITVVSYRPALPTKLRFRFRKLFDLLMRREVKRLVRRIGVHFDIVWSFEPNLYTDLRTFGASCRIFHPVDLFEQASALDTAASADIVF